MIKVTPEIVYGYLPIVLNSTETVAPAGELDQLTIEVAVSTSLGWQVALQQAGYTSGKKVGGYAAMFVERVRKNSASDFIAEISVDCVGLMSGDEKRRRKISVSGQQVSIGPIEETILVWSADGSDKGQDPSTQKDVEEVKRRTPKLNSKGDPVYKKIYTPSGVGEKWNIHTPIVTVNDTYFVSSRPSMTAVGTASWPINAPVVSPSPWSNYGESMRFNHPNGWVLDNRQIEELYSGLYAVVDTYGYYYSAIPD